MERSAFLVSEAIPLAHALVAELGRQRGIRVLLIKGELLARQGLRLPRVSSDADVLVDPARFDDMTRALKERGWYERVVSTAPVLLGSHAITLVHKDWPCDIDLHHFYLGIFRGEQEAFEVLWRDHAPALIAGVEVQSCSRPANALMLALHCIRDPQMHRMNQEFEYLVGVVNRPEEEGFAAEIFQSAIELDALGPAAPFFAKVGIPVDSLVVDSMELRKWDLHVRTMFEGRTVAWVYELAQARGLEKIRILAHAMYTPEKEFRDEHPWVAPGARALRVARWRRFLSAVRAAPNAISSIRETRALAVETRQRAREADAAARRAQQEI